MPSSTLTVAIHGCSTAFSLPFQTCAGCNQCDGLMKARPLPLLLLLLLGACQTSHVVMNRPLPKDSAGAPVYTPGYTLNGLLDAPRGEVLLALAFSGGGKRSAAFAYGALLGLRSLTIAENTRRHTLLNDVDYISAVSGGSFPAVHYGLYREQSFNTFESEFLKRDVNAFVWGIYLLPWNWEWLINPLFGTNDAMAAVYDRLMFHGATYADLAKQGLPMISVEATDIAGGIAFPFNQNSSTCCAPTSAAFRLRAPLPRPRRFRSCPVRSPW